MDGARLAFRPPLMRSAIYHGAPSGRRRAAHRALAASLPGNHDLDRRAWHRGVVADGPDEAIAAELAESARRARRRGGHGAACAAMERAADLTPDPALAGHRLVLAAGDAVTAGRGSRVPALLARAAPLVTGPADHADMEYYRGLAEADLGHRRVAYAILRDGAAPAHPVRAVRMLVQAGRIAWQDADGAGVVEVGRRLEALDAGRDPDEGFAAGVIIALSRLHQGDLEIAGPMLRAAAAEADLDDPAQMHMAAVAVMFAGDDRTAGELLTRAVARARVLGAVVVLPRSLANLTSLEVWRGSFVSATAHAEQGVVLARESGQSHAVAQLRALLTWVAAVQGRAAECTALAAEATELAEARGIRQPVATAVWALAVSDLGAGRWPEAMTRLEALAPPHSPQFHPIVALLSAGDLVEVAVRLDRRDLARQTLSRFEGFVRPTASAWTLALLTRCRALLADDDEAEPLFWEALDRHTAGGRRFDEARTHLLYGEFLRRARRRGDARSRLRTAVEIFARLGAGPWERRAEAELRATGETARRREPGTSTGLTPQQAQIIRLVADGAGNKDVAAQLFLSPRTVDYHLRNVFVKLGITSRTQLLRVPELYGA